MVYQVVEHTADVGIEVSADSIESLFVDSARGFYSLAIGQGLPKISDCKVSLSLKASDLAYLLADWLSELLYRLETEQIVFTHLDLRIQGSGPFELSGSLQGGILELGARQDATEIKAVTYHRLVVGSRPDGWSARVYFDV